MLRSTIIRVDHMCCGMEAKMIRDLLDPMETVAEVKISLTDKRVNVQHRDVLTPDELINLLNAKHLGASLVDRSVEVEGVGSSFTHAETVRLTVNATQLVLFAATVALECVKFRKAAFGLGLATVALSFALFQEAYLAVLRRSPNVELMMAIAMAGALAQGEVVEAASVGALVTLMDLVKVFALEAVGRQLRGSIVSEPLSVDVPGGGRVLLSDLAVGDVFMLRVGDVVPADGVVVAGTAAVDESHVTGEAMPQGKRTGDRVVSGAIVSSGYVHVKTEAAVAASFQARVHDAVEDAKATLSETEALVGRFATWYTPTVLGLAVALGCYKGLQQFLVVLVAGCPCALLGAAPFVQGATLTLLAGRHRLLVKHATTLESLARIVAVGLDKTGTLTTGQFELLSLEPLVGSEHTRQALHRWVAAVEDQDNHPLARSLVASYKGCVADFVASGETLPEPSGYQRHGRDGVSATVEGRLVGVGNAAFLRATLGGSAGDGEEAEDDPDMPPRMRAALERRKKAAAEAAAKTRDPKDPKDCAPKDPAAAAAADAALRRADAIMGERAGSGSVLFVTVDGVAAGVLLLDDSLKPEAAATVAGLKELGVRPILLTGDRPPAAARVAKAVGIADADTHAGLLPEEKQRHILAHTWPPGLGGTPGTPGWATAGWSPRTRVSAELEEGMLPKPSRGPLAVGFVGDGLNDCPALASAHVGIVLQEVGSQATVDAASAVLQVEIDQLPAAIAIARRSRRLVWTNLFLALAINVAVIALAATVGLPLWLSVLSDSGGLLVVLANSLWPLTWRVGAPAPRPRGGSLSL